MATNSCGVGGVVGCPHDSLHRIRLAAEHRIAEAIGWALDTATAWASRWTLRFTLHSAPNATIAAEYRYECSHTCGTSFCGQ